MSWVRGKKMEHRYTGVDWKQKRIDIMNRVYSVDPLPMPNMDDIQIGLSKTVLNKIERTMVEVDTDLYAARVDGHIYIRRDNRLIHSWDGPMVFEGEWERMEKPATISGKPWWPRDYTKVTSALDRYDLAKQNTEENGSALSEGVL